MILLEEYLRSSQIGRALLAMLGADQREAVLRAKLGGNPSPYRTDRSRMPKKTHRASCRAAASFCCAARLDSNSAGGM